MNSGVHTWEQEGIVSLWRYTEFKNKFEGWHLTANVAGVHSLVALVRALAKEPGAYRTVKITPPSDSALRAPNYSQGRAAWAAPERWQLSCSPIGQAWEFPPTLVPAASLTFGEDYAADFVTRLGAIPRGEGDHSIGHQDQEDLALWFWWRLDAV